MTAFVSAIIGGLLTALFVVVGTPGVGGGSGGVTIQEAPAPGGSSEEVASTGGSGSSVREVYTRDGPGVVSVDVVSEEMGAGGGSGFVIDEEGHIVTNQHVVEGAEELSVRFAGGDRMEAEVVGEDPSTDVAVIKVDAPGGTLRPLTLGDSDAVGVGEPVIAIGNPLNVGISVTTGIVSGKERPIPAPNDYTIDDALQTDAAINPGNSGGPLLDSRGTVIGVNAQIATESGGFEGVGFAVPINTVKGVVRQLITTGEAVHGFIGVQMFDLGVDELSAYTGLSTSELRERYDLPENGAIVSGVTDGGPSEEAGIEGGTDKEIEGFPQPVPLGGDVITAADGDPVASPDDVIAVVNSLQPGDDLTLTVKAPNEDPRRVEVTVGEQPEEGS